MSLYVMCFFSLEVSRHIKASIVAEAYRAAELSRVVNHNTLLLTSALLIAHVPSYT